MVINNFFLASSPISAFKIFLRFLSIAMYGNWLCSIRFSQTSLVFPLEESQVSQVIGISTFILFWALLSLNFNLYFWSSFQKILLNSSSFEGYFLPKILMTLYFGSETWQNLIISFMLRNLKLVRSQTLAVLFFNIFFLMTFLLLEPIPYGFFSTFFSSFSASIKFPFSSNILLIKIVFLF